ncbi:MAG TPA: DUF456 domain-containing protein [Verrucomicrobiae bacterium]|nr:DUF456 domain-containing protein [Verrucomicrobiae bacterium]
MDWLAWGILLVCLVVGLAGAVVPMLPGLVLILIGVIAHKLMVPGGLSWWTVVIVGVLFIISVVSDSLASVATARLSGAGKWGLWGALAGGFVGLFFAPVGLIVGPLVGAFAGELLLGCRELVKAMKAGAGAGVGVALAMLVRVVLGLVMVIAVAIDLLRR